MTVADDMSRDAAFAWASNEEVQALIDKASRTEPEGLTATEAMVAFKEAAIVLMDEVDAEAYLLTVSMLIAGILAVKRGETTEAI